MKKLISMIITILVISSLVSAYAIDLDFSSMSDEEVLEATFACQQELVNRRIGKSAMIPDGVYIVGVDIPAGSYYAHVEIPEGTSTLLDKNISIIDSMETQYI